MTEVAQENGNNREVVDEIVSLSKKYGIITNYTSFLVTDPSEVHGSALRGNLRNGSIDLAGGVRTQVSMASGGGSILKGGIDQAKDMNMFHLEPTVIDERHYTSGRADRHNMTSPTLPAASSMPGNWGGAATGAAIGTAIGTAGSLDHVDRYTFFPSPTGAAAVANSKAINTLKQQEMLANNEDASSDVKSVEDKTFYLRNGVWVDSAYNDKSKPEVITFGTDQYFDLLHNNPGIAKYLAVGKEVIFIFKGHTYKIVAAATS